MNLRDPFKGCWDRYDRAVAHRDEAVEAWNAFLDDDPYEVTVDVHEEGEGVGRGAIRVQQVREIPSAIPLLLGEFLYNLRAALDAAVYATAIIDSGWRDPPPRASALQFPICDTPAAFLANASRIAPLTERHRRWIEQVQPYAGGDDPRLRGIWWLNHLGRLDRHRGLRLVGGYVAAANVAVRVTSGASVTFDAHAGPVFIDREDGAVVARFSVSPWVRGDKVEANPDATISVEVKDFADARPPESRWLFEPLNLRLFLIQTVVDTEVGRLEYDAMGSTRSQYLARDWPGFKEP